MNNVRRKNLQKVYEIIESAKAQLEEVLAEEEECRDNMPESLWETERYERMEEACESLEGAIDSIDEVLESIESAME